MSEHLDGVLAHKQVVAHLMQQVITALVERAIVHDNSKFTPEEFDAFESVTPILKTLTYGSDEYKASLLSIQPALRHHYMVNRHHPEYYPHGIDDMDLIDMIEMVCDWMAAAQRQANGDVMKSLEVSKERFHIDDQLLTIIRNTMRNFLMNDVN